MRAEISTRRSQLIYTHTQITTLSDIILIRVDLRGRPHTHESAPDAGTLRRPTSHETRTIGRKINSQKSGLPNN